jgi:hypothetical protein
MLKLDETSKLSSVDSLTTENIQKLVDKTLAVYQVDASRVIADYRAEKQYTADYDGRQILELLQNADDAETDAIHIEINTATKTLSISNNGNPFSLNGVKSLMLANMSPKNKKEYIGNKGLGFRSILNWVRQVDVVTQDTVLQFSVQFAKENYDKILKNNAELIDLVANDKNLANDEIPFAVLAIPDIKKVAVEEKWITTIKLHYKEEEENTILSQLETIQEETLLFLKHTNHITILKNGEAPRVYEKSDPSEDKIQVNDKIWNIYHSGERAYDATKMYSYQIAWQDDLSDEDGVFYTYFPTNVKTHLPCLIHATFDLNASRKEINPSVENLYILDEIASTLGELAITKIAVTPSNWQPYQFLNPKSGNDNKVLTAFYKSLFSFKKSLAIYPATDNNYYKEEELYIYDTNFSAWVLKNDLGDYFPKLLKPVSEVDFYITNFLRNTNRYKPEELHTITDTINPKIIDLKERAHFIKLLTSSDFENLHRSTINLPLLIDRQDGLSTKNQLFTIRQEDVTSLNIPSFVSGISFILPEFFTILVNEFEFEIKAVRNESEDVSRPLKRIIDNVVNIGSNDIIDVIRYVVTETRKHINTSSTDKIKTVKELTAFLFSIFAENRERRGKLPFSIPLLSRNKSLVNSDDLYFGREYQEGQLTEYLFDGIYNEDNYLAGNDIFELGFETEEECISFFTWLGVNKFIKFQRDEAEVTPPDRYQEFVFKSRPDLQKTYHYFRGIRIIDESILKRLSIEKLLVLLSKDPILKSQLDENHKDTYKFKYGSGYPKNLYNFPSFIEYQITNAVNFSNYIIEKEIGVEHLFKTVDFENELFSKFSISINEVKALLEKLGAVKSLDSISIDQFYSLFHNQEDLFPEGKGSSSFYKRFLEYCSKNKEVSKLENSFDFSNFKCFARKGGLKENPLELLPVSEIYYSDNVLVPQDVLNKYYILFLPKRLGEQNVKKYFGVKLIQDVLKTIHLDKLDILPLNNEFNEHINRLKPYFLYYRLDVVKDENSKNDAINLTKNIDIKLVKKCSYHFGNGDTYFLEENFFIKIGGTYYIKKESCKTLECLIDDLVFSDTVAEVLNTQYKVKEHHDRFRAIFKDRILETEYVIKSKDGEELLNEAKELLGISKIELDFWSFVFRYNAKKLPEHIANIVELKKIVKDSLNFELSDDYSRILFDDFSSEQAFNLLSSLIEQGKITYDKIIAYKPVSEGLFKYHSNKMGELINIKSNLDKITQFVWAKLSTSTIEKKKKLNSEIIKLTQKITEELDNQIKTIYVKQLNLDYEVLFSEHIKSLCDTSKVVDIMSIYDTNLISLGNPVISDLEDELKSLFYFEWKDIEELRSIAFPEVATETASNEVEDSDLEDVEIVESRTNAVVVNENNDEKSNGTGGGAHSQGHEKSKRKKGKAAEKLVRDKLVALGYKNVSWVSGNSDEPVRDDSLGYDIRYTDENGNEKFLEVKAISSDTSFFISENEKKCGLKHSEKYIMALVLDNKIHFIKDFFKFDKGESFDNNKKYTVKRNNYKVHFMVENKD